ncbi:MAG: matrixin family metalloprotease [Oscillospiraceae bacterium]|nr:matrixin family metalloprotease [Oscillospiraceae bacterium]
MKKGLLWMSQGMLVGLIMACIVVPMLTLSVSAYSLESFHLKSKSASFVWGDRIDTPGSVIRNAWESAISDWASASSCDFYSSSNSVNELNSFYESSSSLYGRTKLTYDITTDAIYIASFEAKINAGNSSISRSNVARSTANHEFGHLLGINDLSSGTAIMNTNRERSTIYIPQTDDINGVAAVYG